MVVIYATVDEAVAQDSHFPERLGLFTIIVLGETVIAVSYGVAVPLADLRTVVVAASGFAISVAAWWLYFWRYDERLLDRALRAPDEERFEARQQGIAYVFSHYGVHAGIVAAGVGIAVAIESALAAHPPSFGGLVALCGGVATFLFSSSFCHRAISELIDRRMARTRRALAAVLLLLVPVGTVAPSVAIVPVIALALLGLIVYEARLGPGSRTKPASEAG